MTKINQKVKKFPKTSGVYIFHNKSGEILYVGKAASLRDRVNSYFTPYTDDVETQGIASLQKGNRPIEKMIDEVADVKIKKTDTVIEAYFLEQELIKKHQPKYNVMGKDDKSASYVCITNDDFPRFVIKRRTDLERFVIDDLQLSKKGTSKNSNRKSKIENRKYRRIYGPYTSKNSLTTALKILRRIFPYHNNPQKTEKGCLGFQIGLCPGPHEGKISKKEYAKNIRGVEMIFKGKKKMLIKQLEKEMEQASKEENYEVAAEKRNQVFALQHIQDIALISTRDENFQFLNSKFQTNSKKQSSKFKTFRIEGYDISNISGKFAVGSMIVFDNKSGSFKPSKNQYRKFKIKTVDRIDDVAAMREVLTRRFKNDWDSPNLIILDGGKGHLNMAKKLFKEIGIKIPILAIAKGASRKNVSCIKYRALSINSKLIAKDKKLLKQITDEAHRFAISYHKHLRRKNLRS